MSQFLSDKMPQLCVTAFDGRDLEHKLGDAYLLLSTDPDGTARVCMLSAGEILALGDRTLRVALWQGTHTAANLARNARVVVGFIAPGTVLYIKGMPRRLAPCPATKLECFEIRVERVDSDAHEGMPVSHGLKFLPEARLLPAVLETCQETLRALREAGHET